MSYTPPPRSPRPIGRLLVAVAVVIALVLLATGGLVAGLLAFRNHDSSAQTDPKLPSPSATVPMPKAPSALGQFYKQKLQWRECGRNECTKLTVPLDYAKPDGETLQLAVLRVPALDRSQRVGQLVVNPGGPGGSGVQYASAGQLQFGEVLSKYYDLVGFDPRGVGFSDPLECMNTAQTDKFLAGDPDPDNAAERGQLDDAVKQFGAGCLRDNAALTKHMSTVEVAKDMDVLRAALGERQLDYFGASYGTLIGATYANLFPTHVRRMVLDGALDPALSNEQLSLAQAHGFEVALRAYVQDCISQGSCFLGDTVDAGTKRIRALLDQIEAKPLRTSSDRELTAGTATLGVWLPLYVKSFWPDLSQGLKEAMRGDGTKLLSLADQYSSRGPNSYYDNSIDALYAVNCLDHDDFVPTSEVPSYFPEFEKSSPTFGRAFAFSLSTCSVWPVQSGSRTTALHAPGAPPIVVIGTTRDPATPLAWAKGLASELDSGVLITRDGDGHTGFQQGNSCVDNAVDDYLVKGTVPKNDLSC